jgi:hypothetical protein
MLRIRLLTCRFANRPTRVGESYPYSKTVITRAWVFELIPMNWVVELRGFEPRTSCMPWKAGPFTGVRDSSPGTRLSRSFVQIGSLPFTRVHRGR